MQTMAFGSGDYEWRGPLKLRLTTGEEFRNQEVLIQMLELFYADTDVCLIGDGDCKPST